VVSAPQVEQYIYNLHFSQKYQARADRKRYAGYIIKAALHSSSLIGDTREETGRFTQIKDVLF
jgi:stage III sporulation protein SpoIIIAA